MTRIERLRRVILLCSHCVRNLAYYQAQRSDDSIVLDTPFWRTMHNNAIDMCVLEWCKLFGDARGAHHWSKVVDDVNVFWSELLHATQLSDAQFDEYRLSMRQYRDRFVAHLDSDSIMHIPNLSTTQTSVYCYHRNVVRMTEIGTLSGLPLNLEQFYDACYVEAKAVVDRAASA